MPADLVWIESGRQLPRYARKNFKLTSELHRNVSQVLIADKPWSSDFINVLTLESIEKSSLTEEFLAMRREYRNHQEYFWKGTTSRFFHLYDYMKSQRIHELVHAETDVVILDYSHLDKWMERDFGIAYPLQSSGVGIASIFLVKRVDVLEKFLIAVLERWHDYHSNDMTLLGEFANEVGVLALPSNPSQVHPQSVKGLFDAGTLGPYFMGSEARNYRIPFRYRGRLTSPSFPMTMRLTRDDINWKIVGPSDSPKLYVEYNEVRHDIVNLHIHSKQIPKHPFGLKRSLERSFSKKRNVWWKLGSPDLTVVAERLISFFLRKLRVKHPDKNLR